jgi:tetratricopeptide (TPR) repeat protein
MGRKGPLMSRTVRRRILLAGLGFLLVAGAALGAYTVFGRREVTTSSSEALRYYRLGLENEQKMYYKDAIQAYAEALKHDPNFVMATVRLAALTRDRDPERARSLFECARLSAGSLTERERLWLRFFEVRMNAKEAKELEPILDEYVRRFPEDPEGHLRRAMLYSGTDRMPQAVADLQKVIALDPNFAYAYNELGYYSLGQADYLKAEEYFRRYLFLAPDQANPNDSLGDLYIRIGRYEEADEFLKKALEVKPDFYAARAHLGTLEVAKGNLVGAAEQFRTAAEATELVGQRREWLWTAALTLAVAGKGDEATAIFAQIPPPPAGSDPLRQRGAELASQLHRGLLAALVGRTEEAKAVIGAVPALLVDLPESAKEGAERALAVIRGFVARREGKNEEAAESFRAAILDRRASGNIYFPDRDMLRVALAKSLVAAGRTAEAEEALKPVLSRNPKFQPALDVLARVKGGTPAPARS